MSEEPKTALELDLEHRAALKEKRRQQILNNPKMAANIGRWKKGDAKGAGRPKSLPRFRFHCRELTFKILREIERRMGEPEVTMADLIRALNELANRGGYLNTKEEADLENTKARLILAAMALELNPEQRQALLKAIDGV